MICKSYEGNRNAHQELAAPVNKVSTGQRRCDRANCLPWTWKRRHACSSLRTSPLERMPVCTKSPSLRPAYGVKHRQPACPWGAANCRGQARRGWLPLKWYGFVTSCYLCGQVDPGPSPTTLTGSCCGRHARLWGLASRSWATHDAR